MAARPQNEFPTIRDVRDRLSELVERGLGDLAVQVLVVPDATMQAVARASVPPGYEYDSRKPALMIELEGDGARMPVFLMSTDRMGDGSGPNATPH
jgi:hypothetical protein